MTTRRGVAVALAATTVAWVAVFAAWFLPRDVRVAGIDLLWTAVCFAAFTAALAAVRDRPDDPARRSLVFAGAGALSWGLGQLAWTWYDVVEGEVPYPSIADIGFAGALPLLAAAIVTWPRRSHAWTRQEVVDGALLTGAVLVASFTFVLGPILEEGLDGLADLVLLAYPLGDVALLAAALVGIAFRGFEQQGRLAVLAAGLLALVAADTGFALAGDDYATGALFVDPGWTLGFAAIGATALLAPSWGTRFQLPRSVTPLVVLGLLAAAGLKRVVEEISHAAPLEGVETALVFALLVLLAGRLFLAGRSREREASLRQAMLEATHTGVCVLDGEGVVKTWNSAWERVFGGEDWPALVSGLADAQTAAEELRFWTSAGRCVSLSRTRLDGGETVLFAENVTAEARERLTRDRFLAEVVRAQDLEARRIAELLHDDAVQRLTALGLRLELAALRSGESGFADLAREAGEVTGGIRRLLVELHPAVLESQGLSAAVESAAAALRRHGVSVEVDRLDQRFAPEFEQLAYRLLQEALLNAGKHAGASRVDVAFTADAGTLTCTVEDDGRGLDADAVETAVERGGLGLQLARERIELAGGSFELGPRPGGGTRFAFVLPIARQDGALEEVA